MESAATRIRYRVTLISRSNSQIFWTTPMTSYAISRTNDLDSSVTYYESNRPRQYYPDFIVVTRDADGKRLCWLAETKGEIRPNTKLKSSAAISWCEKMSRTAHGSWNYLFVPQPKFENAMAKKIKSVRTLSEVVSK